MNKPISPKLHGILDYAVVGMLAVLPASLGLKKGAVGSYAAVATNYLAVNSLTDTPVGIKKVLTFKAHQKADIATLGMLAIMTMAPAIRKDKKALYFHVGFMAMVATQYLLTDFEAKA